MLIKINNQIRKCIFPQANDIYKVIKYIDQVTFNYHNDNLRRIGLNYVRRQDNYYRSAATFLGLLESNTPTKIAEHIFKLDKEQMLVSIVQLILQDKIFAEYYINRKVTNVEQLIGFEYALSNSTAKRRTNTVKSWIKWCDAIIEENNIEITFI